ncbi:P-loop containing nucleoside triphosphate hydrolase protein [Coniella lustricola]|uniref:P-loop containing nucleoside triphosphate hydrolase protein n=1 Tax=Coniella lustricola TaxID=2025994 RepID=A0A2T2ZTS5_9PEZI|nr:P-loop containing nucleoside triphosphate hydrolase protein [Coniella lustricola]
MKVLVLGLPRTGTQSLADALAHLGISPVYHMRDVGKNGHQGLWLQALDAKFAGAGPAWGRAEFDEILAGNEGVADFPAAVFVKELLDAYPEAAVLLTIRSEDAWYQSMMSTLWHAHSRRPADATSSMAALSHKYHTYCWNNDFPAHGRQHYHKHNDLVRESANGRAFLEFDVKDGWAPLCAFLGIAVPDEPFPRKDDWLPYKQQVAEEQAQKQQQQQQQQQQL